MIEKKYVYEIQEMDCYKGMMRLDLYITMSYFNASCENENNEYHLINIVDLCHFITECMVELFSREYYIDLSKIDKIEAKNFYISSIPVFNCKKAKKIMVFNYNKKSVLISESRANGDNEIKTKDINKDFIISLVLNVHQAMLHLVNDVVKKCSRSKKLTIIEENNVEEFLEVDGIKEDVPSESKDKFDIKNYDKLN